MLVIAHSTERSNFSWQKFNNQWNEVNMIASVVVAPSIFVTLLGSELICCKEFNNQWNKVNMMTSIVVAPSIIVTSRGSELICCKVDTHPSPLWVNITFWWWWWRFQDSSFNSFKKCNRLLESSCFKMVVTFKNKISGIGFKYSEKLMKNLFQKYLLRNEYKISLKFVGLKV